jgi:glutathione S-transferase
MNDNRRITLFHAPNARSAATLLLLEELGVPYDLQVLNLNVGEQHHAGYLAVNPMGKVPALRHGDAVITEQVAIFLYLADLFPGAGLAPLPDDALRGPYLRWMVFYAACFEPALVDRSLQRDGGRRRSSPYGDYDTMLGTLTGQLARGPWMLGERFSAADVLWGMGLTWTTRFGLIPERVEITTYLQRFNARPAVAAVARRDSELAAAQQAATKRG